MDSLPSNQTFEVFVEQRFKELFVLKAFPSPEEAGYLEPHQPIKRT